ncbi:MAG: hypothetical protein ABJC04_00480 [Verrucomicrobiota bacterium]
MTLASAVNINQNIDVDSTTLMGIKNFLVESNGFFQGGNNVFFGYDLPNGYVSITNRGAISASAIFFRSIFFNNSGSITSGNTTIQATEANLSNGTIEAQQLISLSVGNLLATNSILKAGEMSFFGGGSTFGKLVLDVTNSLTDLGANAGNFWQVTDGFTLMRRPLTGDLHGTEIRTVADGFHVSQHLWAGQDRGPGSIGFNDNAALGRLVLDIQNTNAILRFAGTDTHNALYVGTLEINFADPDIFSDTNVVAANLLKKILRIDGNLKIYYTNLVSNVDPSVVTNFPGIFVNAFPNGVVKVDAPIVLREKSILTVTVNGLGVVTPNLNGQILSIGSTYQMTAKPAVGQVFGGWTGSTNTGNPVLTFQMQSNFVLQANFIANPYDTAKGIYTGLFFETNGVRNASSGLLTFTVTKTGQFSGRIFSFRNYSFRGKFDGSGFAQVTVVRPGLSPLLLTLQLNLATSDSVQGTVSSIAWTANFSGDRSGAGIKPIPQSGKYTLVIAGGTNSPAEPAGDGFGTLTVNATGNLTFKGVLADGTKISQRVPIAKNGDWPFYVSLYRGGGFVLSRISISTNVPALTGTNHWIKQAGAGGFFPNGFTNATEILGSRYVTPPSGTRVLQIDNGTVVFSAGNLNASITNNVMIGSNNKVTVINGTQTTVTFSLPTGLMTGSFIHPATAKKTKFQGVVLQEQQNARGFFLGPNQSGAVLIQGN